MISHDRITLIGGSPGTTIDGAGSLDALSVFGSHGITIIALNLTGAQHGLFIGQGSTVSADSIRTFNNDRGIEIFDNSFFRGTNIESHDNLASGFRINASTVWLDSIKSEQNGSSGITATASHIDLHGTNVISKNTRDGILMDGSQVNLAGITTSAENHEFGIVVQNGSTLFTTSTTINANPGGGINVQSTSHATFVNGSVTNNGGGTGGGGIHVGDNSDVYLNGTVNVTNNTGAGVQVELSSVFSSLGGNQISTNTGDGVLVRRMGMAHFFAPDTMVGNGGASVACDTTTLVVGDVSSLARVRCPRVTP